MAGSLTVTPSDIRRGVISYFFDWTSDASGNVSGILATIDPGMIITAEFIPAAGDVAPTALHDIDLLDAEGANMLDDGTGTSVGANLPTTAVHRGPTISNGSAASSFFRMWLHGGQCELRVSGAGDSNQGRVRLVVALDPF